MHQTAFYNCNKLSLQQPVFDIIKSIMMDFRCGVGHFIEIIVTRENNNCYANDTCLDRLWSRRRFIAVFGWIVLPAFL
jgi:hypothetical protein